MDLLKTLKRTAICAAIASTALTASAAYANTSTSSTVTVIVHNAFTLTETQAMNFATVVATTAATGTPGTIVLLPAGGATYTGTTGTPRFISVTGTPKQLTYTVGGALHSTVMSVDYGAPVIMSCNTAATPGCASGGTFSVSSFVDDKGNTGSGTFTTDAGGAATINVGATVSTVPNATQYKDGQYTGTWAINVNY